MEKKRSPNYPYIDIERAEELTKKFFDAYGKNSAAIEQVMKHWGYSGKTGSAIKTVAAVISYGLLDRDKKTKRLTLSKLAINIILNTNTESRIKNLQEAAVKPKLFNQLFEKYNFPFPPLDAIVYDLISEHDFIGEEAAMLAAKNFLKAIEYANFSNTNQENDQLNDIEENLHITKLQETQFDDNQKIINNIETKEINSLSNKNNELSQIIEVKTTVTSGIVTFSFPNSLNKEDADDIKDWLDYIKKKINRAANLYTDCE